MLGCNPAALLLQLALAGCLGLPTVQSIYRTAARTGAPLHLHNGEPLAWPPTLHRTLGPDERFQCHTLLLL